MKLIAQLAGYKVRWVLIYRKAETNEWVTRFCTIKDGAKVYDPAQDYYTSDKQDAKDTGEHWLNQEA